MKPTSNDGQEDKSPCRNELLEYFDQLQDSEKELIKTIPLDDNVLSLDHVQFGDLIVKSLSLEQLGKLSSKQVEIRGKLIDEIKRIRARLILKRWGEGQGEQQNQKDNELKGWEQQPGDVPSKVQDITEAIITKYRLVTIEESKQILYYKDGVYVPGGDVVIEKESERMYGYALKNKDLAEIKGHIIRNTYHKREEFDANIDIINLKNGLYDIQKNQFKEHTRLSVNKSKTNTI